MRESGGAYYSPSSLFYTLLAQRQSLYNYTLLYWPFYSLYMTLLYPTGLLAVPISLYHTLLADWQSLYRFTIFYCPTDSLYESTILYCYTNRPCITLLSYIGPLTVLILLYYSLLAHWHSLYHSTIFYWPITNPISLYYTLLAHGQSPLSLYWHTGSHYITILLSTGLSTFPISLNYTLLAHCKPYITLLYSTGPRIAPFSTLLAHWQQSPYHYTTL